MKTWLKVLIITIVFGAPTVPLGNLWWPPMAMPVAPTPTQMGLLIFVGIAESIAFGLGVAFLIYGWKAVKSVAMNNQTLAKWMYVSIAWSLVSWWPHDRLHMHYGLSVNALVGIEYGFHITLITGGLIVAYGFLRFIKGQNNSVV